jgi:hypothetical protein
MRDPGGGWWACRRRSPSRAGVGREDVVAVAGQRRAVARPIPDHPRRLLAGSCREPRDPLHRVHVEVLVDAGSLGHDVDLQCRPALSSRQPSRGGDRSASWSAPIHDGGWQVSQDGCCPAATTGAGPDDSAAPRRDARPMRCEDEPTQVVSGGGEAASATDQAGRDRAAAGLRGTPVGPMTAGAAA